MLRIVMVLMIFIALGAILYYFTRMLRKYTKIVRQSKILQQAPTIPGMKMINVDKFSKDLENSNTRKDVAFVSGNHDPRSERIRL